MQLPMRLMESEAIELEQWAFCLQRTIEIGMQFALAHAASMLGKGPRPPSKVSAATCGLHAVCFMLAAWLLYDGWMFLGSLCESAWANRSLKGGLKLPRYAARSLSKRSNDGAYNTQAHEHRSLSLSFPVKRGQAALRRLATFSGMNRTGSASYLNTQLISTTEAGVILTGRSLLLSRPRHRRRGPALATGRPLRHRIIQWTRSLALTSCREP